MQRIAIFTTDDGGEVAIQVVDDAPPDAVESAGGGVPAERRPVRRRG